MKYTNNLNLPEPLVVALMYDDYDAGMGDFTPSSLIKPPYMAKLLKMFDDKIVKDVSDNFHLMMGKMVHSILELSDYNGVELVESNGVRWIKRIYHKENFVPSCNNSLREVRVYSRIGAYLVGAQLDHFWLYRGILNDYKNTSVYKFKRDYNGLLPDVEDWAYQLNITAFILRNNPMVEKDGQLVPLGIEIPEIKGLQIIGLLKDHSKTKAKRESGYPKHPIAVRDIGFLSDQEIVDYVNSRGDAHVRADEVYLKEVLPCAPEETWQDPPKFAVMKTKTAKKSSKNCADEDEARAYIRDKASKDKSFKNAFIQRRDADRRRCDGYCDVSEFCPNYLNFLADKE